MESRQDVNEEQYLLLLEFMERHGDIARPQLRLQNPLGAEQLWQELTSSLNAIGPVHNSSDQWKKVWADWKCQTLEKAMKILCNNIGIDCQSSDMVALMAIAARQLVNNGDPQDLSAITHAVQSSTDANASGNMQPSTSRPPLSGPRRGRSRRPFAAARRPRPTARPTIMTLTSVMRRHGALPPRASAQRRQAAMNRVALVFADIEKRRMRLEEMKLRKEERNLDLQERINVLLGRLVHVAEGAFQAFLQKNRPQ